MRPEIATRLITSFGKRFGKPHLYLAYHAAFPLALTPDLLYRLWATFQRDTKGLLLNVPWVAVADLLLSSLCRQVGYELYEMDLAVRNELLKGLIKEFGQARMIQLSDFLLEYVRQDLKSNDPYVRDLAQAQSWIALAYTQPTEAAYQLASQLSDKIQKSALDAATPNLEAQIEVIRLKSLLETLAEPLEQEGFKPLLTYAKGMVSYIRDDLEDARANLQGLFSQSTQMQIAGEVFSLPSGLNLREEETFVSHPQRKVFPDTTLSWHTFSVEQTLELLGTDAEIGLNASEVKQRQQHYGSNEIEETAGRSSWEILLDQFKNIMLLMLISVAISSGLLDLIALWQGGLKAGPFKDTIAILAIVILNGVLGYLQESRAEKAMEAMAALKRLPSAQVLVIRAGEHREIDASALVPGDIMLVEMGTQLAADGRIIEAANLFAREAALTGEAEPIQKQSEVFGLSEDTPISDRLNMVFRGTEAIQGRAKVVVTSTGMETELGKIAQILQSVESEPTPLQQRMTQLGNVLVTSSLVMVAFVVGVGLLQAGNFSPLQELVEVSLSMAVAVVPKGLPAVITVCLALGMQRMIKRNALIRKLPAVETLGSVNVICSEKTGTLTQNKMVVQEVKTFQSNIQITGEGYAPIGDFLNLEGQVVETKDDRELQVLLLACILCNDAILTDSAAGRWSIIGAPTEGALLALAGKAGLEQQAVNRQFERVGEFPFSSERKCMSIICQKSGVRSQESEAFGEILLQNSKFFMFTKGSSELILDRCQSYQLGEQILTLTADQRQQILKANDDMAGRGLRVLGFAYKILPDIPAADSEETVEQGSIWLGLVAMFDPPRPEVPEAIAQCHNAGIQVTMMTGDYGLTAEAIARQIGLVNERVRVLTGEQMGHLSDAQLRQILHYRTGLVFARMSREHKLRLMRAFQDLGNIVAVTGLGVNDAPALRAADIGIAMGMNGTDVALEAADIVLLDDNFATIVAATEEGRVVYQNIRLAIKYMLGGNIGRLTTIAVAPLIGMGGVPLTPLQTLWIDLVIDAGLAVCLAVEPADPNIMRRPPFSPRESIFARGLGSYIVRVGIIYAIITISLMNWSYNSVYESSNPESWKTMVFTTLCLAQMGHAIALRSSNRLSIEINPFTNPYLLISVVWTTILQLTIVYVPPLRNFFGTELLTLQQLLICLGFSSLIFVWLEGEKFFIRWYRLRLQ